MKREKIQVVRLSETEKNSLDALVEREGCSPPDLIRRIIIEKYNRVFPPYIQEKSLKKKKEEYYQSLFKRPVEELCDIWIKALPRATGGIVMDEGVKKCMRKRGGSASYKPLEPKIILVEAIKDEYEAGSLDLPI